MYLDYAYYIAQYGGEKLDDETFRRYIKKASRLVDVVTSGRLKHSFPEDEDDAEAVKDCICEVAEFLREVDAYKESMEEMAGVTKEEDGTVRGKLLTSVTSGTESRGYSVGSIASNVAEAAKDKTKLDQETRRLIRSELSGIPDANGVLLLYAGLEV